MKDDKHVSVFARKVYDKLLEVPAGRVTTYKELAKAVHTKAYQSIGQVMRSNPYAPDVPCHRVVASDGSIGGFMGETQGKAIQKKVTLLKKECVTIENNKVKDFEEKLFTFSSSSS